MIEKAKPKSKQVIGDKRGQAGQGFLDHPIVYVIILFGLAAIIGSVMMMIVGETDNVIAPTMDTPVVSNESWVYNTTLSATYCNALANDNLQVDSETVYNSTWAGTKDTDYNISYITGTVCNLSSGAMVNGTYGVDYKYDENKWNESYANIVTGVALGFSMYQLVALMGIMSIILPMLFLMFSRRRET